MYIVRYVTDKGTRQSEPVGTIESARYLRAEILANCKPQDVEIVSLTGKIPQRKARSKKVGKKPKQSIGKESLGDVLAKSLKDKGTVKVANAAQMAIAAGYKTQSKQFANIVSHTLANDDRFRKIRRGLFKVK